MSVKASPIVHALPYPALEAGNLSFPEGEYQPCAKVSKDGLSIEIEHSITGAAFLESLIAEGKAQYGCLLSIPKVGIRRLALSNTKKQKVSWEESVVGEPPKVRPVLLYTGEEQKYKLTNTDGVAEIWQGKEVILPKGAKLARGNFLYVNTSEYSFLRFKVEKEYKSGTFKVEPNTEDGFFFNVNAAEDIFNLVQNPGDNQILRLAVLTNAVSRCFDILKESYKEGDDNSNESFSNLKILSDKLHAELGYDWNDDNFDSTLAATTLYPIRVSPLPFEEGDE